MTLQHLVSSSKYSENEIAFSNPEVWGIKKIHID